MAVDTHIQRLAGVGTSRSTQSSRLTGEQMEAAYERCGFLTSEYAKTFYLGTQLMTPEKAKAIWAIYVWCRRTDELVDGPNAARVTPAVLDRWEQRLEEVLMALYSINIVSIHSLATDVCWSTVRRPGRGPRPHGADLPRRHPVVS